jgi:serine/threonine protein kinase
MARNPGTEAEAANATLRAGSGVTPTAESGPGSAPLPVAKTGLTHNPSATPTAGPQPAAKTGTHNLAVTPTGNRPPPIKTGAHNLAAPPPAVKTGLTNSDSSSNPTPLPSPGRGLHAPATTPGPVVQAFVPLGRYQLLSRLAVGGMAEVYLARQGELSGFKTLVVVKKVLPHLAVKPDFIAMFLDEARIASMLDHPNVVRITEVGRAGNEYFLAMELVQGKPLAAVLQQSEKAKTPIPHTLGALIVANAAAGLHHAHQLTDASGNLLGLVHRDVSPQNIMVSFEGSVKVIDFGIARALGRLGDTNSGSLKGKLGYMAPEQARGETVDARADIFSLGVVLWECVAGRRLFLRENELATLRAVVYEPVPSASKFAEVDPALDAVIRRSVARNVEERFQTAEEMHIALEKWVFSAGGASSHDLSALMKSWFPSDYLQWQRAARLALDMQESDPPIDIAFPNLAANKTGHSRTGASRPEGSGSGPKFRSDSSSRAFGPLGSTTPIQAVPDLRPRTLSKLAVPLAVVLSVLAAGGAAYYYATKKPSVEAIPEEKSSAPVRPMVETLPAVEGTTAGKKGTAPPHVGETPRPSAESTTPGEETTHGKKKNRGSSGEKRAILHPEGGFDVGPGKRPNPFDAKSSVKKTKDPRPNPF